jgi:hypothetical protein
MLVEKHKLKRDYKITWIEEEHYSDGEVADYQYECIITDCYTRHLAWQTWYENVLECDYDLVSYVDIEPITKTHQDRVNDAVYALVLAELFTGPIAVLEKVYPQIQDDFELTEDLQCLEQMIVEHQAQLKFDAIKNN